MKNLMYLYLPKKAIGDCKSNLLDHTSVLFKNIHTIHLFYLIKFRTAIPVYNVYYNLLPLNLLEHFSHTHYLVT